MASGSRPSIRALLIDLSGTLHVGSTPTPGAVEALRILRSAQVPFRFCSNTSKESTSVLSDRLRKIGFDINPHGSAQQEVWTSLGAVQRLLADLGLKRPYCLLSDSARKECTSHLESETQEGSYDSVIVGLSPPDFTYDSLNTAFRILKGEHATSSHPSSKSPPLIATHKAKYVGASDGHLSLGPGPFVSALEIASGTQALVVGKPTRTFFELVMKSFDSAELSNVSEENRKIAVIGDDVEADLGGGALELGLWRVLVKTGKYRPGDETRSGPPPDEVFDSFAAFVEDFLGLQKHSNTRALENGF